MNILGFFSGHDANASIFNDYDRVACIALERISRIKCDGRKYPWQAVDECLRQADIAISEIDTICLPRHGWKRFNLKFNEIVKSYFFGSQQYKCSIINTNDPINIIDLVSFLKSQNLTSVKNHYFFNHHIAHALGALSCVTWEDGLVYTADGGGDADYYTAHLLRNDTIQSLFPKKIATAVSEGRDSIGLLYAMVTEELGFKSLRHEGKVLGLAAFGKPAFASELIENYFVEDNGYIRGKINYDLSYRKIIRAYISKYSREDVAASLQVALEYLIISSLEKLIIPNKVRNLALSGGVFANVKLNQRIQERFQLDQLFVYPAMSDAGLSAGGCLEYLLHRDGTKKWLLNRSIMKNVYLGLDYSLTSSSYLKNVGCILHHINFIELAAKLLQQGKILGLYLGRMEYGPRALGNRTILAQATDRSINSWLNKRLERTDFMPFAPVVRAERANEIFDISNSLYYACKFMTTTVNVRENWKERIPAVVHVDGTARPQIISRDDNPIYYDIVSAYEDLTDIPVLINTSFNAHEEPIINSPADAFRALSENRVDFLLTEEGLWSHADRPLKNNHS